MVYKIYHGDQTVKSEQGGGEGKGRGTAAHPSLKGLFFVRVECQ